MDEKSAEIELNKSQNEIDKKSEKSRRLMIAKDMEVWSRTFNQKKGTLRQTASIFKEEDDDNQEPSTSSRQQSTSPPPQPSSFSLSKSSFTEVPSNKSTSEKRRIDSSPKRDRHPENHHDSEDSSSQSPSQTDSKNLPTADELKLIDWSSLLCLLCRRKFLSRDQLTRHQEASELHKTNLAKLMKSEAEKSAKSDGESRYRDRARERRLKYGQPETPGPKQPYVSDFTPSAASKKPHNSHGNIGAKMMMSMGWSEGQGLGRDGKTRSSVIEVQRRPEQAGLGIKATHTNADESYKDAVRRAMRQRFKELSEKDGTS